MRDFCKLIKEFIQQKINGVVAFFSAKDIPGKNNFMPAKSMPGTVDEEIFASSDILFHNQPVGMVVADTMEIAIHAANFVETSYKEQGLKFYSPDFFETYKILIKSHQNADLPYIK